MRGILRTVALLLIGFFLSSPQAAEQPFDDSAIAHIAYPDWFKTSFLDLQSDLEDARKNDKDGLMLLFTTEGCSYCDLFIRTSLADPELATLVRKHFDSIGMEIFDDTELTAPDGSLMRVKKYAKDLGAVFSPTLVFLGLDGQVLLSRVGYQSPKKFEQILGFLIEKQYQESSFRDYLQNLGSSQVTDYVLREDELFVRPPFMLDRSRIPASRPMIVLFEKTGCAECAQFHDVVLADASVREKLQAFEVVRLDANDAQTPVIQPDGLRATPSQWFYQAGLTQTPAMLFFDEHGDEVLRTDALVLNQRMMNSLNYVLEKAYLRGWTYQRFARSKGIEKLQKQQQ